LETADFLVALFSNGLLGVMIIGCVEKLALVVPSAGVYLFLGMRCVHGPEDIAIFAAATALGSTAGSICWYAVGRLLRKGRTSLPIHALGSRFSGTAAIRWLTTFGRIDFIGIAGLQLLPAVRVYSSLALGALCVRFGVFATATFLGSAVWNGTLILVGALFSRTANNGQSDTWTAVMVAIIGQGSLYCALRVIRRRERAAAWSISDAS
jgi:membrane protein DedA with SNARE-associated domain